MPHKIRMKTIFAFSDIHEGTIPPRLLAVAEESDYVFFLGDGAARMGDLALHKGFFAVKGNCDYLPLPEETVTEVEGVKILLTHGHRYGVKTDLLSLALRAEEALSLTPPSAHRPTPTPSSRKDAPSPNSSPPRDTCPRTLFPGTAVTENAQPTSPRQHIIPLHIRFI